MHQPPIPGYEPIRQLGINLCTVYLARHSDSGALVALKVYRRGAAEHARDFYPRLARLDHPNILRVIGIGDFEEYFYCALEFFEKTLADRLVQGPLPPIEVLRLTRALASAVQYARGQGMLLLILTPETIVLTQDNIPQLHDFHQHDDLPTPPGFGPRTPFMAPEDSQGIPTPATDVYRVGAVMYAMLTGLPPFASDEALLLHRPRRPREVNPKVSRGLDEICMKCLEKRPDARYASAQHLADNLKSFL